MSRHNKFKIMTFVIGVLLIGVSLTRTYTNAANTLPGTNLLVSVNNVDGQGLDQDATVYGISADGNVILFATSASNLPGSSTTSGLYIRNVKTNTTTRVDVSTNGVVANSGTIPYAVLSETGRYVAFISWATNLTDGVTEPVQQTYIRDTQTNTTTIASIDNSGNRIGKVTSLSNEWDVLTGISNDGRFITLETKTISISPTPNRPFVLSYINTETHAWTKLNLPQSQEVAWATGSNMSCDGSFVVFSAWQSNLPSVGLSSVEAYVADVRNSASPKITAIGSTGYTPRISCNGDYITYTRSGTDSDDPTPIPSGLTTQRTHLVLYNRVTGERKYIDSNSAGTTFDGNSLTLTHSATLRQQDYFKSSVSDKGDVVFSYNGQAYLKHLSDGSGTLEGLLKDPNGTYLAGPSQAFLSADGRFATYSTSSAYALGLLTSTSTKKDVVRSATGL